MRDSPSATALMSANEWLPRRRDQAMNNLGWQVDKGFFAPEWRTMYRVSRASCQTGFATVDEVSGEKISSESEIPLPTNQNAVKYG